MGTSQMIAIVINVVILTSQTSGNPLHLVQGSGYLLAETPWGAKYPKKGGEDKVRVGLRGKGFKSDGSGSTDNYLTVFKLDFLL